MECGPVQVARSFAVRLHASSKVSTKFGKLLQTDMHSACHQMPMKNNSSQSELIILMGWY